MPTSAPWSLPSGHLRKRPGGLTMLAASEQSSITPTGPGPTGRARPGPGGAGDGLGLGGIARGIASVRTRSRITFVQFVWSTPMVGTKLRRPIISHSKVSTRQRHLSSPPCHPYSLCLSSSRPSGLSSPSRPAPDSSIPWSSLALLCPSPANHRIMYSGATMPRSDAPRGAANHALPLPAPAGTRPSAPCPLSRRRPSR